MTEPSTLAHHMLEQRAHKEPHRTAYVVGEGTVSYQQYNLRANRVAEVLSDRGVGRSVPVGISVRRGIDLPVVIMGVLKAGGVCVPFEPDYPDGRIQSMVEAIGLNFVISDPDLVVRFHSQDIEVISLNELGGHNAVNPPHLNEEHDTAFLLFTSGSTGMPKIVERTHANITIPHLRSADSNGDSRTDYTILLRAPISHSPFVWELFAPLAIGANLVIARSGVEKEVEGFINLIRENRITHLSLSPSHLGSLLQSDSFADCKDLVSVDCSGEPLPHAIRSQFLNQFSAELTSTYGCTETPGVTTYEYRVDEEVGKHILGIPSKAVDFILLDKDLQLVPDGEVGEIFLGGPQLAKGYFGDEVQTAERFIHWEGKNESLRLFRTGDLGRKLSDGRYEYLGRNDQQVQIRGFRVELLEIEAAIEAAPCVRESAVALIEIEQSKYLIAYLVLQAREAARVREVRDFIKTRLPDYMIPTRFVVLDQLPRNANGKLDQKNLPQPSNTRPDWEDASVSATTDLQRKLLGCWEDILNIRPLGIADHFFDWGGNSLSGVRLLRQIQKITAVQLPLDILNIYPTVELLSAYMEGSEKSRTQLVPLCISEDSIPFFWIHGPRAFIGLPKHLGESQTLYALLDHSQSGKLPTESSVEEFAANYVADILSVQKEGPYRLGGYCSGSIFALEVARQLMALEKKVSFLFLVEPAFTLLRPTYESDQEERPIETTKWQRFARLSFKQKFVHIYRRSTNIVERNWWKFQLVWCKYLVRKNKALPLGLRRIYIQNEVYGKAFVSYKKELFPGKVYIHYSGSKHYGNDLDWSHISTEPLEPVVIKGSDHLNILDEPYVEQWAQSLADCLEQDQ